MDSPQDAPDGAEIKPPEESAVETATKALAPFLSANKLSEIAEKDADGGKKIAISSLWGESSILVFVPDDVETFATRINNIYLPENFTGIWHSDTKKWEIIWTALKVGKRSAEVLGREFTFNYRGKSYQCGFRQSSDALMALAENARIVAPSLTDHRNLISFIDYINYQKRAYEKHVPVPTWLGEPTSFWIEDFEWDEDFAFEFATCLNFYITYYDNSSPAIVIHTPKSKDFIPRTRYITGSFPRVITGKPLDDNLLVFWNAARSGDPGRKFQLYYRIVEYAAGFYIEHTIMLAVRRILSAPNAVNEIDSVASNVIGELSKSKLDDYKRFELIISELVSPALIQNEMNLNPTSFTEETLFDGNCKIKAVIGPKSAQIEFSQPCYIPLAGALRDIRNALSHGREVRSSGAINPTIRNFQLLEPWVSIMSVIAGEVMLYRDLA